MKTDTPKTHSKGARKLVPRELLSARIYIHFRYVVFFACRLVRCLKFNMQITNSVTTMHIKFKGRIVCGSSVIVRPISVLQLTLLIFSVKFPNLSFVRGRVARGVALSVLSQTSQQIIHCHSVQFRKLSLIILQPYVI